MAEESKQLLLKLLALADKMERRDAQVLQGMAQQSQDLTQSAQAIRAGSLAFAEQVLEVLRAEGAQAMQQGMRPVVQETSRQMQQFAMQAGHASDQIRVSADALHKQRSVWMWSAPLALIVGSLLAAGGSSWWAWKNMAEIKRAAFGKDILEATRSGRLTRCGEGKQLCVRVGAQPKRFGTAGEYLLLAD